jgi:formamidopyrimidine-DNA glycosylase
VPELPDIVVYLEALAERVKGATLEKLRLASPFLVRSVDPPIGDAVGHRLTSLERIGKRIVFGLDDELFLVLHLMISGRLRWETRGAKVPGKVGLAALDFSTGTVIVTEASSKKRASLHLVRGRAGLEDFRRGGIEPLEIDLAAFTQALTDENHTLKRSLTDPRLFSGIGNAYSDEILHRARLSPVQLTKNLKAEEIARLYEATQATLRHWLDVLRADRDGGFP